MKASGPRSQSKGRIEMAPDKKQRSRDGKIPVAVLGATGAVGQRMIQLLEGHPLLRVAEVAASERSAGKRYVEATRWFLPGDAPQEARDLVVKSVEEELTSP